MEHLDAFKPLKTVCGLQAEVMFFDTDKDYPMHVKIISPGGEKTVHAYTKDGFYRKDKKNHFLNLVNCEAA